jgi:hypothetical protein
VHCAIILSLVALWLTAEFLGKRAGKGFVSNLSMFWAVTYIIAPLIAAIISVILAIDCYRLRPARRWLLSLIVLTGLAPLLSFLRMLA